MLNIGYERVSRYCLRSVIWDDRSGSVRGDREEGARRVEREECRDLREVSCVMVELEDSFVSESDAEDEGDRGGVEVCVPTVRLNIDVMSSVVSEEESSSSSSCFVIPSGIVEMFLVNLSFKPSTFVCAVSNNECRAEVRDSSIGSRMYFEVP